MSVERIGRDGSGFAPGICDCSQGTKIGTSRLNTGVFRHIRVRIGDMRIADRVLVVIETARNVIPGGTILRHLDAARLGVVPECVAVDNEVHTVGVGGAVLNRCSEFINHIAAEVTEGYTIRIIDLNRTIGAIDVAPAARGHALVGKLTRSGKEGIYADVVICGSIVGRSRAADGANNGVAILYRQRCRCCTHGHQTIRAVIFRIAGICIELEGSIVCPRDRHGRIGDLHGEVLREIVVDGG